MDINHENVMLSDAWAEAHGFDRSFVHFWWAQHVPEAQAFDDPSSLNPWDDNVYWNMILEIQRFVFADTDYMPEGEVDGMLGPMTITRMETYTESLEECPGGVCLAEEIGVTPSDHIIFAGEKIPVEGVEVVSFEEPDSLSIIDAMQKKYGEIKGCRRWPGEIMALIQSNKRYANFLGCLHWDAGWSAPGAFRMLVRRALATCVGVDRPRKSDQKVIAYQWLDPGLYYGFHGSDANKKAVISFDLSNAVYRKYAKKYEDLCGILRPVVRLPFRASGGHLGMYVDQILTTLRILKAVSERTGLPLVFPQHANGKPVDGNYADLFKGFKGVMTHENLPKTTKWDIRCFQQQVIVLLLKRPELQQEFPSLREAYRLDDEWCQKLMYYVEQNWQWSELGI